MGTPRYCIHPQHAIARALRPRPPCITDPPPPRYIRGLLDRKMLYGSWCCSRTNFHHPGATAFFTNPPKLPLGREATAVREGRAFHVADRTGR